MLCSSCGLGDQSKKDFARIDMGITEAPVHHLGSNDCLSFDLPSVAAVITTQCAARDRLAFALLS
jgi:hypothetical protein